MSSRVFLGKSRISNSSRHNSFHSPYRKNSPYKKRNRKYSKSLIIQKDKSDSQNINDTKPINCIYKRYKSTESFNELNNIITIIQEKNEEEYKVPLETITSAQFEERSDLNT